MTSKFTEKAKQIYVSFAHSRFDIPFVLLLLLLETLLCSAIIHFVAYTEIDWEAYMQQVDLWQAGEYNYRNIRGSTGPLVYPSGFLYLYGVLKRFTNDGTDVHQAQVYFIFLYILTTAIVLAIYTQVSRRMITRYNNDNNNDTQTQANLTWSWRIAMACCCLSKRIHSIFVLRLFNDGPAMLLLYVSVLLFMNHKWRVGCVFFSLAVSIKMNILLFAPGLLLLLLQFPENITETIVCLGICATIQLLLGAPFLLTYPEAYIRKAFEFDRIFFYKWTVNWKFLPEETFVSKPLSLVLLALHLSVLAFLATRWLRSAKQQTGRRIFLNRRLSPEYVAYTLAVSNFVGICFARTLHYQFYVWYFHTFPLLLWISGDGILPILAKFYLMGMIEYAFNVFPATPASAAVLQPAHLLILLGIVVRPPQALGMAIVCGDDNDGNVKKKTS